MNSNVQDFLLRKCIDYYTNVCEDEKVNLEHNRYGFPPESIIIAYGRSEQHNYWVPLVNKESVFRFSSQRLQPVPLDTVPDFTENRMYYKEAYAELCYHGDGFAFMMIQFGKRYAKCFRYQIECVNEVTHITNEKLLWVS